MTETFSYLDGRITVHPDLCNGELKEVPVWKINWQDGTLAKSVYCFERKGFKINIHKNENYMAVLELDQENYLLNTCTINNQNYDFSWS